MFRFFFIAVTIIFIPLHLYIGYHLWQSLTFYVPSSKRIYYWLVFILLSSSFIFARVLGNYLPDAISGMISAFGYLWIIAMFYLFGLLLALDLYGITARLTGIKLDYFSRHQARLIAVLVVLLVIIYGSWNSNTPRVTRYDISIPKAAGELTQLKAVLISDLHLGKNNGITRFNRLPIILLNHQPINLDAAQAAGVDLQLSGHTHSGQIFPGNLLTTLIFEQDWGYLKRDTLQLIVTCGIGTWGPDLRIGSKSEIVEINIIFD